LAKYLYCETLYIRKRIDTCIQGTAFHTQTAGFSVSKMFFRVVCEVRSRGAVNLYYILYKVTLSAMTRKGVNSSILISRLRSTLYYDKKSTLL